MCVFGWTDILNGIPSNQMENKVNGYVIDDRMWDWTKLDNFLPPDILLHLAAYRISRDDADPDTCSWNKTPLGIFSTKSAFKMLVQPLAPPTNTLLTSI